MNYYVYQHVRLDTNSVFYVGKGSKNRYRSRGMRNRYWKAIVKKTEFIAHVVAEFKTEAEAYVYEAALIDYFKAKGQCAANLQSGGVGGRTWFDEIRQQRSRQYTEAGNPRYGVTLSLETRKKISESLKGRPGRVTRGMLGKRQSAKQRAAVKNWHAVVGENHPQFKGWWVTPAGTFTSRGKVAELYGINKCVVSQRCKSTSRRFKDWYFISKEAFSDNVA